jgi:hypothetical protein
MSKQKYRAFTDLTYTSAKSGEVVTVPAGHDFDDMNEVGLSYELAAGNAALVNDAGHPVDVNGKVIPAKNLAVASFYTEVSKNEEGQMVTTTVVTEPSEGDNEVVTVPVVTEEPTEDGE